MQNPNVVAAISLLLVLAAIALAWQKHYYLAWVVVAADVAMLAAVMKAGRNK